MSVDVEDWFQVENLRGRIYRDSWSEFPLRVEDNTLRLLDLFAETGTRATFFCLGWIAERKPALIRRIVDAGHEVASHGYGHNLLYELSASEVRADIERAHRLLEDTAGRQVIGYRAPSFSITPEALEVLRDVGYAYDSSVFPVGGHDRYASFDLERHAHGERHGQAERPRGPGEGGSGVADERPGVAALVKLRQGLWEFPITTWTAFGTRLPWGGGGYFRLLPPALFRYGFERAMAQNGGAMFYLHPWEVDPGQPRVFGLKRSYAFRHYVNLGRTLGRLRALCRSVPFTSAERVLNAAPHG
jgi:polysaccharide deacetylase family protein (PEP-CTERM system associated)